MRHMFIRVLVVIVALAAVPAIPAAQNRPSEADLLVQTTAQPRDIGPLLDLAKLYKDQGRINEAMGMLNRAMSILREEQSAGIAATPTVSRASQGTLPAGAAIRVGGDIKEPQKIKDVKPVYPDDARAARVQGIVILEVIVGQDGSVTDAQVLRSVPMLDQAALEAVRQWAFTPTLLNGMPVSVIMTVTVNFALY